MECHANTKEVSRLLSKNYANELNFLSPNERPTHPSSLPPYSDEAKLGVTGNCTPGESKLYKGLVGY